MSNRTKGPRGIWVNQVKWLASLNNGTTREGYIGVGDNESTEWQKLQTAGNGLITQLRLQYRGITIYGIPHADAYTCKAAFAFDPMQPQKSYQEQAILGSMIGETWFIIRLSQDGQIWQEIKQGQDNSCVRGS